MFKELMPVLQVDNKTQPAGYVVAEWTSGKLKIKLVSGK